MQPRNQSSEHPVDGEEVASLKTNVNHSGFQIEAASLGMTELSAKSTEIGDDGQHSTERSASLSPPLVSSNDDCASYRFPKIIPFDSLARCGEEVWIENNGQIYRLRKTKQGKLILTK